LRVSVLLLLLLSRQ